MLAIKNVSSLKTGNVSLLNAVMFFFYLTYIIIYAMTFPILDYYINKTYAQISQELNNYIQNVIQNIAKV